ncbi:MAG TPA: DEAD/DEAH box helicase family protein [Solirubrobacteraceae bacterium]|nr:DEAD/DEAH box helicase family protein [Solirubrobacteraceae bacterium]
MAEPTPVALEAAPAIPDTDAIARAAAFTREPFTLDGEQPAAQLAPGSARRGALDDALAELEAGAEVPSVAWRQRWSLLLGLDRLLSQEEPKLVDGTVLNAHQVDALSGTLTALLAEAAAPSPNGRGAAVPPADAPLASPGIPGEEELEGEDDDEPEEPQDWDDEAEGEDDDDQLPAAPEDPNAGKRFWFEHATGAGKTVAALGFVEGSRTGGILILTHRRNLVDQFLGELRDRGYGKRISPPLVRGQDRADGPVTVETYQWFVRNAGNVSDAYTIVICDEAHTALGEKTSASIRNWHEPVFVGMTATGALIARHVTDLFPTQTSRFDLAQAARRGVIAPLRCVRIPPGPGVRTIAKVPLRRGEVDTEFDQEMLAELLDQLPFNLAIADLYKTRFNNVPGVVYAAGVRHAYNVAEAFRELGLKAEGVSGETPKRELAQILARYERGDIDVLVNAQLLAEGWNSPRATVCMHLAPTASKRIYQQRVGRVTRRHPGKEAGIVVDFVHPATKHDDPVVTLHSLLDRDVYRGGAIVVGPVRRGRGRRLRVERRVLPVTADENRRIEVFERELWRIAVEHLDYGEQVQWAALAGARVAPAGWRRARAMLHFDQGGELKRTFLITAVDRNKNAQLRLRALQEIAASKDAEAFDRALDFVESWPREDKREGVKTVLLALAEKQIGRRDQANNWIWRCANMTREVHEEYAVQRWPETKRLLGLLVNSSGGAHARNARRLVHAARQQDRRLSAALLAAAIPHTAEAGEVVNGARMRMSRKPAALARELLRNFPKGGKSRRSSTRRRKRKGQVEAIAPEVLETTAVEALEGADAAVADGVEAVAVADAVDEAPQGDAAPPAPKPRARRARRKPTTESDSPLMAAAAAVEAAATAAAAEEEAPPKKPTRRRVMIDDDEQPAADPKPRRRRTTKKPADAPVTAGAAAAAGSEAKPARRRRAAAKPAAAAEPDATAAAASPAATPAAEPDAKPVRRRRAAAAAAPAAEPEAKPMRRRTTRKAAEAAEPADTAGTAESADAVEAAPAKPARRRATAKSAAATEETAAAAPKPATRRRASAKKAADAAKAAGADDASALAAGSSAQAETAVKAATRRRKVTSPAPDDPGPTPEPATRRRSSAAKKPKDPQPVAADEAA